MTTITDAREAIYQHWAAGFIYGPDNAQLCPYCFENEQFDPPAGRWARLSVRHFDRNQETLGAPGNRKFERRGAVLIQLFDRPFQRLDQFGEIVAKAEALFDAVRIEGTTIRFQAAITRELGIIEDGRWLSFLVECNFVYDEIL